MARSRCNSAHLHYLEDDMRVTKITSAVFCVVLIVKLMQGSNSEIITMLYALGLSLFSALLSFAIELEYLLSLRDLGEGN